MTATRLNQGNTIDSPLHLAFELGQGQWLLAFTTGLAQAPRLRAIRARDRGAVLREIAQAKKRFGLADNATVLSCYEAGRDGFWLHRWLVSVGVNNRIIDSSSIEVNRKKRRAKDDKLDAGSLVRQLVRYELGDKKSFSVLHVPSETAEDHRHLHRELLGLKDERTSLVNKMKGLLCNHGVELKIVNQKFLDWLQQAQRWDNTPVPPELQAQLRRLFERWQLVHRQIRDLEVEERRRVRCDETPAVDKVRRLLQLRGVGVCGAWMLVKELFWRQGLTRRKVGAILGLVPTPYSSSQTSREQGISKAGNKRLRRLLVELAWCWLRHQPDSKLSQWFHQRFGQGPRLRRLGITAVARKLAVALWRFVEQGEVPDGAELIPWQTKMKRKCVA